MSTLKDKANSILTEKNSKITPSNIKKGVQIFDVTGTYGGSGGDIEEYFNLVLTDENRSIIKKYPEIDSSKLTNFGSLFSNTLIDTIPDLDYSNAREMGSFANASYLSVIPNLSEAKNCMSYSSAFQSCPNIVDCTGKVINCACKDSNSIYLDYMFQSCGNIISAPEFDFSEAGTGEYNELYVGMTGMFSYDYNLTIIPEILPYTNQESNIKFYNMEQIIENCPKLTKTSIENILKLICYCNTDMYYASKTARNLGIYFRQLDLFSNADIQKYITNNNWTTGYEDYSSYQLDTKLYNVNTGSVISNDLPSVMSYFDWFWQENIDSSSIREFKSKNGDLDIYSFFNKNLLVDENGGYLPNVVLMEQTRYLEVARINGFTTLENNILKFTTNDNVIILFNFTNNMWNEMENANYWELQFRYNAVDENGSFVTELHNEYFMYNTEPNPIQNKKFAYHTYNDFTQYSGETLKLSINCACYINSEYKEVDITITNDDIPVDNSGKIYNVTLDLREV